MHVTRLEIRDLRRFDGGPRWNPAPGLNLITGDNGAGKTSVLEALHLMAYGRSFRGRVRDGLIRSGDAALEVFVEWRGRPDPPDAHAPRRPAPQRAGWDGPARWRRRRRSSASCAPRWRW